MMLSPLAVWAIDEVDPRVARIVAATIGIDTHNHIDVQLAATEVPGPNIDLAHCNTETVAAALKLATHPVIISHTGLDSQLGQDPSMARMMRPRLISKEQARVVADAGGVIGVWTHLSDSALEYARNIRALVDVIGIDHVCIGTDTKLTPAGNRPSGGGGAQPGDGQNRPRVGERTNLAWRDQKVGFYYAVVDALLKTGFTEDEIGKVGGGNFCRVFDAATAGHS